MAIIDELDMMAELLDDGADDATIDGVVFGPKDAERGVAAYRFRRRCNFRDRGRGIVTDREGKDASCVGGADDGEFAAEESGQMSRDSQAEAGAAVEAGHRAINLAEGFEDNFLLVGGDAGAGIRNGAIKDGLTDGVGATGYLEADRTGGGEFDGVAEQVDEDLADAGIVGEDRSGNFGLDRGGKVKALLFGAKAH